MQQEQIKKVEKEYINYLNSQNVNHHFKLNHLMGNTIPNYNPSIRQSFYYTMINSYMYELNDIFINDKPLLITGKSGVGKSTPFKVLSKFNLINFYEFHDFYSDDSRVTEYKILRNHLEKIRNYFSCVINNRDIHVIDNFGLRPTVKHFDVTENVINHTVNLIEKLKFQDTENKKKSRLIIITGLTYEELLGNTTDSSHYFRRLIEFIPEQNIIDFEKI